jgi:hypothetical protein
MRIPCLSFLSLCFCVSQFQFLNQFTVFRKICYEYYAVRHFFNFVHFVSVNNNNMADTLTSEQELLLNLGPLRDIWCPIFENSAASIHIAFSENMSAE